MSNDWTGVDLDGTLARYDGPSGGRIGAPVAPMVRRVKQWLKEGRRVRIFTARVSSDVEPRAREEQRAMIERWCLKHLGSVLPVTSEKDYALQELWDDRAVRVVRNTGALFMEKHL